MPVRISVNNIGPLKKAEAEVKPLTLLLGPNNSGKSTLATLMYAALSALPFGASEMAPDGRLRRRLHEPGRSVVQVFPREPDELRELVGETLKAFGPSFSEPVYGRLSSRLREVLGQYLDAMLRDYAQAVKLQAGHAFGSSFPELARMRNDGRRLPEKLLVEHWKPSWKVEIRPRKTTIACSVDLENLLNKARRGAAGKDLHLLLDRLARYSSRIEDSSQQELFDTQTESRFLRRRVHATLDEIFSSVALELFSGFPRSVNYLPAARSGILQSHRLLASTVVRRSPFVGIEDVSMPRLTGLVSNFVSQLLALSPERAHRRFSDVINDLETSILGGRINIDQGPASYPEISYQMGDASLPLHRTSSMVSELAPVIIYLRYVLRPGDLLIIEEPEAHLHPESQIHLANAVSRLVSAGLQVVLTTHSDYFFQQLNNSITAAELKDDETVPDDVRDLPKLSKDQVAAYAFRPDGKQGTTIEALPIDPREGVTDPDFARVSEDQYDQMVEIDRRLLDAG